MWFIILWQHESIDRDTLRFICLGCDYVVSNDNLGADINVVETGAGLTGKADSYV